MNRGAMRGPQPGLSEVPAGGPSASRSTMTAGNPGRAQFSPAWVNPPKCGAAFDEGGRYGRATPRFTLLFVTSDSRVSRKTERVINLKCPIDNAMTEGGLMKSPDRDVKEIIPWLKDNPVHDVLEQRKREAMEIIQDITRKELEIIGDLPEDVRELIKVPDGGALIKDF